MVRAGEESKHAVAGLLPVSKEPCRDPAGQWRKLATHGVTAAQAVARRSCVGGVSWRHEHYLLNLGHVGVDSRLEELDGARDCSLGGVIIQAQPVQTIGHARVTYWRHPRSGSCIVRSTTCIAIPLPQPALALVAIVQCKHWPGLIVREDGLTTWQVATHQVHGSRQVLPRCAAPAQLVPEVNTHLISEPSLSPGAIVDVSSAFHFAS